MSSRHGRRAVMGAVARAGNRGSPLVSLSVYGLYSICVSLLRDLVLLTAKSAEPDEMRAALATSGRGRCGSPPPRRLRYRSAVRVGCTSGVQLFFHRVDLA